MKLKSFLLIAIFTYVSYRFIVKYSKDEFDDAINALKQFQHSECPAGILLYRLTSDQHVYRLQLKANLPHQPLEQLKRCERYKVKPSPDKEARTDVVNTEYGPQNVSGYIQMDSETSYIINDACAKMDYGTNICVLPSQSSPKPAVDFASSNTFLSYMLEVVKGPHVTLGSEDRSESENWSIETLAYGIFPGTLWCGFGNIADDIFGQLGEHSATDECCRSHDLCRPVIKAFQTRFHHTNRGVTPISHCGCDMQFYNCLKRVDSPTSRMIGRIFFKLVKMKCFDLDVRDTCTASFLGICRKQKTTCVAILKNNKAFPT